MNLEPFNDRAHGIVSEVLDYAEDRLARDGTCASRDAAEYLALDYIKTCGDFIEHSVVYLENDERIGADLFLAKLPKGRLKARFERNARKCASQLSTHTHVYFPDYPKLLRLAYLHVLANTTDLDAIRRSGVLMLASATLPGVRTDIRRELRRRGATWDRTIVQDATLERRIGFASGSTPLITLAR